MKKGKRAENQTPFYIALWQYVKERKKIFIPAGAGFAVLIAVLVIILTQGEGGQPPETQPSPSPSPIAASPSASPVTESSPSPAEPSPSPDTGLFHPLTGLPVEESLQNRPVAVMHNNSHGGRQEALPMFGISQADIIYEVLAEGGITRMMALYSDIASVPQVGSVRSARKYYLELALAYDAVLVHVGGNYDAIYECIPAWDMDTINAEKGKYSNIFWRDKDRLNAGIAAEHTMFASGSEVDEAVKKLSRSTVPEGFNNGLLFDADTAPSGGTAGSIKVPFTKTKPTWFHYNPDDGLYYVEEYNMPFIDGQDGSQIAVTNVLILQANTRTMGASEVKYAGDVGQLSIDLTSGGAGYYASGGEYVPVTWSREAYDAPFAYADRNGNPLTLCPGKTYVCIIPADMTPVFDAQ